MAVRLTKDANKSSSLFQTVRKVTGQLSDATCDFACLVFVLFAASARPRVVQLLSARRKAMLEL